MLKPVFIVRKIIHYSDAASQCKYMFGACLVYTHLHKCNLVKVCVVGTAK